MYWIILAVAGVFEVLMTTTLKMSENFSKLWPSIGFFVTGAISFFLLSQAMKTIPVGTAYAVWTGIGAFGTAIVGIVFFKESTDFWRIFFLLMLIVSIIGLKIVSK